MAATMQTPGQQTRRVSQTPTGATAPASARSKRLDYLDALKVALIILVVAHHAGQPYGPTGGLWPVSNPEQALVLGSFFTVNAAFFMGLFFLISAYFVPASFDRKGGATFLKDRFVRLGVPIAGFVLTVAVIVLIHDLVVGGGSVQGFLSVVASLALGEFHLAQLWFVDQLLAFVVLYAVWRLLTARRSIPALPTPGNAAIIGYLVALAVVTFVVRIDYPVDRWVVLLGIMPAEIAHLPQYVSMFVIGLLAYRGRWLSEMPARRGLLWLGIGVTAAVLRYLHPFGDTGGLSLGSLLRSSWEAVVAVGLCLGLIVLFREYVAAPGRLVRLMSPDAYGVYLIQLFVLVPLQFALLTVPAPPLLKFAIVVAISVPVCFALVDLLRHLPGLRAVL
jgi:fucose 4-O-acetylase-like acetyltransferase